MTPGDWSELTRALRAEHKKLSAQLTVNPDTTDIRAAILVLEALENVATRMAGGYVYD